MSGNSVEQSILSMSDADFLNAPMPTFESASSHEQQETVTTEEPAVTELEQSQEVTDEPEVVQEQEENNTSEESETETEEDKQEPTEEDKVTEVGDAEAQLKKLLTPFKANGRDIKIDNVDEAIKLMQQGANYNKKMAALKPSLKVLKMLENNGLLDEQKLTYLIDLDKKNPEAISKLIKDSGIDPLDVNTQEEPKYTPGNYSVSDAQVNLDSVLDSIEHTPTYNRTMTVILEEWDDNSKRALANEPNLIPLINEHVSNGVFDAIATEMMKQRALGNLSGLSDLQAYETIGKQLAAKGAFGKAPPNAPVEVKPRVPTQEDSDRAAKRKAASPAKQTNQAKEAELNPLSMSDEEFEKAFNSKYR
jgi:hypothetical protein